MEYTKVYKNMKITYEELDVALKHKKFIKKTIENKLIYSNIKFDSIVLLPNKKKNELVNAAQFASISYILSHKGIYKKEYDLAKWIEKYRVHKKSKNAAA